MDYHTEEPSRDRIRLFFITELTPIQLASFDLAAYSAGRASFTTGEWIDLLMRSDGFEPAEFDHRTKLLALTRLIPIFNRSSISSNWGRAAPARVLSTARCPRIRS
ncbi:BREX system Lon protease-like protein BrxL [Nitrolancea hollandica]|uniref:Uncharacterized protein n=1 Tax=Nitrolancea hollandica Lb TaxID=1129897 RepID=I4EH24_9BACT|nr:hypothetical protein NITHO_2960008 [Nitrolancea hollandica Lb]